MSEYILASGSPRRKEILTQVGISFKVIISEVDEVSRHSEPEHIVGELSNLKCIDVARRIIGNKVDYIPQSEDAVYVIGADTMVSVDGMPMGKPEDREQAFEMIYKIQGREHSVSTGVSIAKLIRGKDGYCIDNVKTFVETSMVDVVDMSEEEIYDYISGDEPYDKAGGYAIQGRFARYIRGIKGDYYNIVGFPVCRFISELKDMA